MQNTIKTTTAMDRRASRWYRATGLSGWEMVARAASAYHGLRRGSYRSALEVGRANASALPEAESVEEWGRFLVDYGRALAV